VELASDALVRYPLAEEPQPGDGSAVEIAPGVLWLRMPLAGPLRFINVWALAEEHGWTIVDTGVLSPETIEGWQKAFKGALQNKPVVRVIVTHMHPDHCGLAGWFTERFDARLWMSRLEYLTCRLMAADTGHRVPREGTLAADTRSLLVLWKGERICGSEIFTIFREPGRARSSHQNDTPAARLAIRFAGFSGALSMPVA